jgi:hypothetical protein
LQGFFFCIHCGQARVNEEDSVFQPRFISRSRTVAAAAALVVVITAGVREAVAETSTAACAAR